ncbi:hypothetical protein MMC13_005179 [Lambiella insularis]|nr:hypothetical protein [Lambiella insularis]
MDRLPLEILHAICTSLPHKHILTFRLISRVCAAVGAEYLLDTVALIFLPESFARLKAIAEHPIVSQKVACIVYEAETLPMYSTFNEYKEKARLPDVNVKSPALLNPPPPSDARYRRSYFREIKKRLVFPHQIPRKRLKEGWTLYQQLKHEVQAFQDSSIELEILQFAIARFPKLSVLRVETDRLHAWGRKPLFSARFDSCLVRPHLVEDVADNCGERALRTLLHGIQVARSDSLSFYGGGISWKIFDQHEEQFCHMIGSLRALTRISLIIRTHDMCDTSGCNEEERGEMYDRYDEDWVDCVECLEAGRVRDMLIAAPRLEDIDIEFEKNELEPDGMPYSIDFANVAGNQTWDHLRHFSIRGTDAKQADLLDFFNRHARTLTHLGLVNIRLTGESDTWLSVFQQIPEILHLDSVSVRGTFDSCSQDWLVGDSDMDSDESEDSGDDDDDDDDDDYKRLVLARKTLKSILCHWSCGWPDSGDVCEYAGPEKMAQRKELLTQLSEFLGDE